MRIRMFAVFEKADGNNRKFENKAVQRPCSFTTKTQKEKSTTLVSMSTLLCHTLLLCWTHQKQTYCKRSMM
jgi:hypothetical protein